MGAYNAGVAVIGRSRETLEPGYSEPPASPSSRAALRARASSSEDLRIAPPRVDRLVGAGDDVRRAGGQDPSPARRSVATHSAAAASASRAAGLG
jgi:hypothetical protein